MTTTLKQLCNSVLESAAKATMVGKWKLGPVLWNSVMRENSCKITLPTETHALYDKDATLMYLHPLERWERPYIYRADLEYDMQANCGYTVLAANNAEKLARALLVMEEALEKYRGQCLPVGFDRNERGNLVYKDFAGIALTKVKEMLERG